MVRDSVDHRGGVVGKCLAPPPEGDIGGGHDRVLLVSGGDQLNEQVRRILIERDVFRPRR